MELPAQRCPVQRTYEDRLDEPSLTSVISAMAGMLALGGRQRLALGNIVFYLGRAWTWQLVRSAAVAPPGQRYARLMALVHEQLPPNVFALLERAAPPALSDAGW
jgi:hypothetical protein